MYSKTDLDHMYISIEYHLDFILIQSISILEAKTHLSE